MHVDQREAVFIDGHLDGKVDPRHGIIKQVGLEGQDGFRVARALNDGGCVGRLFLRCGQRQRVYGQWLDGVCRNGGLGQGLFHGVLPEVPYIGPCGVAQVWHDVRAQILPCASAIERLETRFLLSVTDRAFQNAYYAVAVASVVTAFDFTEQSFPVFGRWAYIYRYVVLTRIVENMFQNVFSCRFAATCRKPLVKGIGSFGRGIRKDDEAVYMECVGAKPAYAFKVFTVVHIVFTDVNFADGIVNAEAVFPDTVGNHCRNACVCLCLFGQKR